MENQSKELSNASIESPRPALEGWPCQHVITYYTTAGRFAPPQTYWTCSKCKQPFNVVPLKTDEPKQTKKILLVGGVRDGLRSEIPKSLNSIQVAYVPDAQAVNTDPDNPKPWTVIGTQVYRSTYDYDEGYEIFRP